MWEGGAGCSGDLQSKVLVHLPPFVFPIQGAWCCMQKLGDGFVVSTVIVLPISSACYTWHASERGILERL